jgi:hypothetical protein
MWVWLTPVVRHTLYKLVLFVMFSTHHHFDMWVWLHQFVQSMPHHRCQSNSHVKVMMGTHWVGTIRNCLPFLSTWVHLLYLVRSVLLIFLLFCVFCLHTLYKVVLFVMFSSHHHFDMWVWLMPVMRHTLYKLVLFVMFSTHHHFDMWVITPVCTEYASPQVSVKLTCQSGDGWRTLQITPVCTEYASPQVSVKLTWLCTNWCYL